MNLSLFSSHAIRRLIGVASALVLVGSVSACSFDGVAQDQADTAQQSQHELDLPVPCSGPTLANSAQLRAFDADLTDGVLLTGSLGCVSMDDVADDSLQFVHELVTALGGDGSERYDIRTMETDRLGFTTVRVRQHINDLPVAGSEMVMQVKANTGEVVGISGEFVPAIDLPKNPKIASDAALTRALGEAGIVGDRYQDAELTYVLDPQGNGRLAWVQGVSYRSDMGPEFDLVFADAITGELVTRHPRHYYILNRQVYDSQMTQTQGVLVLSEGGTTNDPVAQAAYDYAGVTYNYYNTRFGRDSFDAAGATLVASVHFDVNFNNAAWIGEPFNQMIYGDGDGQLFIPLSQSLDVVAHELTHAVTNYTADLIYQNESGALNEAMSDILGVAADSFHRDGVVDDATWMLGEDIFTPGTPGDALRYMNNPTTDGQSYDYYPTRYTGTQDNGGVHLNSGIANLAFYLLVSGGTHPRGATNTVVPAIGMQRAEQVFYRALATYMTPNTNFEGARVATARAVRDLFGFAEYSAFHDAWTAVGVPGNYANFTTSNGTNDLVGYTPLTVSFTDTSVGAGSWSWNFGDGNTSTDQNPTYTFNTPGQFGATLTINGDQNLQTPVMNISAVTRPAVTTTADRFTGPAPLSVQFTNQITAGNVVGYTWDFGDGTPVGAEQNPLHVFELPGTYTVNLTIQGEAGPIVLGEVATVTVTQPVEGGCSVSSGQGGSAALLLVLVGLVLGVRRRRK